ncbi:hypothetical protein AU197_21150 [Mycobacterium sp. IS-1590]|uniref:hypothetical protein n=1 Tax=Mycobacterium sp. IS-1590 TaxID=1772286 RepID=UPI0007468259|nr:hypothetical protein [Mycobacterium sp. IS-1590]KUI43914.1 hypothetical protein AU197_21150 [Mycobacterium sp. IS-1590]
MPDEVETPQEPIEEPIEGPDTEEPSPDRDEVPEEPETFPRDYVEKLRQENGRYRQRAQRVDDYAHRLHTELVRATGRLADPSDLAFDEAHIHDPDALVAAIEKLITRKPHLATRQPIGDIGQGASTPSSTTVDLAAILRKRAT